MFYRRGKVYRMAQSTNKMKTPIYNTTIFKQGEEPWLGYYTEPEPNLYLGDVSIYKVNDSYKSWTEKLDAWHKSKQSCPIHPTQIAAFEGLAMNNFMECFSKEMFEEALKQGLSIQSENIEIKEVQTNLGWRNRAFLSTVKEEKVEFVDWNKFTMEELADILTKKYQFDSSGEGFAVRKMVAFYRNATIPF